MINNFHVYTAIFVSTYTFDPFVGLKYSKNAKKSTLIYVPIPHEKNTKNFCSTKDTPLFMKLTYFYTLQSSSDAPSEQR